jgi:hypothetical protein
LNFARKTVGILYRAGVTTKWSSSGSGGKWTPTFQQAALIRMRMEALRGHRGLTVQSSWPMVTDQTVLSSTRTAIHPAFGTRRGRKFHVAGIALIPEEQPLLLVCNRNNNRVEHWDLDGNFVRVIQKDLRMPAAVHIRGNYAVFPELQGRVTVLDKDGKVVAQVGDNPNEKQRANFGLPQDQWKDGICNSPHGASMDKDGNLIVSEWSQFGHLHKFLCVNKPSG